MKVNLIYHNDKQIDSLDGLRGIAILAILLFHDFRYLRVTAVGWIGVDLFFVLSGFLITRILLNTKIHRKYFSNFYMRRVLRIFPLYFSAILILIFLGWATNIDDFRSIYEFRVYFLTYTQNFLYLINNGFHPDTIINHFWSLAIEEHFYLFWPLAVFVCKPKRLVVVSVILFVISKLLALSFSLFDLNWVTIYTFTFTRMDALLAGGFIAIVSRRNKAILEKNVTWLLVVVSLLMVAFYTYIFIGNRYQFTLSLIMVTAINSSYSLILLFNTLLCTCILILSLSRNVISEFLKHKILKFFGRISYGLYMIHFPVFMIFNERLIVFFQPYVKSLFLSEVISSLICASAAIIIANISYRYFESRFINLKERFPATSKL